MRTRLVLNIIFHVVILGVVTAVFYVFLMAPQRQVIAQFSRKVNSEVEEIEGNLNALDELSGGSHELSQLRERAAMLKSRFVPYDRIEEAGQELAAWAHKAGFRPVRIIPPIDRDEDAECVHVDEEYLPVVGWNWKADTPNTDICWNNSTRYLFRLH